MANTIETLYKDEQKQNAIYPRTKKSAVSDENGDTLGDAGFLDFVVVSNPIVVVDDYNHPVGTIYETSDVNFNPANQWGGTWELLSSEKPIGKAVFGNGKTPGVYNGSRSGAFAGVYADNNTQNLQTATDFFGKDAGSGISNYNKFNGNKCLGIVTKEQLDNGSYPYSYTGLQMDYITCYTWRRTA